MPRKPGRPTKRSPVVEKAICANLSLGNTREASAKLAGISYATLKRWVNLSVRFCAAVEKAEAQAEQKHVGNIRKAGAAGSWQASAWWLERRGNGAWRKPAERTELSGPNGGPVEVDEVVTSDEQRSLRIAAILQRAEERARSGDDRSAAAPPDDEGTG